MPGPCTRSATCRCDDCLAAMSMFSAKDLMAVSSSTVFEDEEPQQQSIQSVETKPNVVEIHAAEQNTASRQTNEPISIPSRAPQPPEQSSPAEAVQVIDDEEPSWDGFSTDDLINHDNWKARKEGFTQLESMLQQGNNDLASTTIFTKCLNETAMGALDIALDCARAYVQKVYDGKDEQSLVQSAIPILYRKALVGRPSTKQRAVELILDMMEVDRACMSESLKSLEQGIKEKNPKVGAGCVSCFRSAVSAFGAMKLPMANIQSMLLAAADVKAPAIRTEATGLAVDVDIWFKGGFKDIISGVVENEATKKTLLKAMESATKPTEYPAPSRRFRGETEDMDNDGMVGSGGNIDLFDALPEKNILDQLHSINFEKRIEEAKWQERKNAVDEVIGLCGTPPKLAKGEYSDLVRILKALIQSDSNQSVVVSCINLLGTLGAGLRFEFHFLARSTVSLLLNKYRDKKMPLIHAVDGALEIFAQHCFNITEDKLVGAIEENMSVSGDHGKLKSTPLQRINISQWLSEVLMAGWSWAPNKHPHFDFGGFAQIIQLVVDGTSDADPKVRDVSTACLANLAALPSGEQTGAAPQECVALVEEKIEEVLRKNPKLGSKFKAAVATSPSSANAKSTPTVDGLVSASASQRPAQKTSSAIVVETDTSERPKRPPTLTSSKSAAPKEATKPAPPSRKTGPKSAHVAGRASAQSTTILPAADDDGEDSNEPIISDEDALELVCSLDIPDMKEALATYEGATKWQDKTKVFEVLQAFIDNQDSVVAEEGRAFVVFVKEKTKDFKEANFNIMNAAWQVVASTVQKCDSPLPRAYASLLLAPMTKRFGDKKQSQPVQDLALALCEACGPKFIAARVVRAGESVTSPKALEDAFTMLKSIAGEFGAQRLNVKAIVDFAGGAKGVGSRIAPTKSKAVDCLTEFFRQVGEPIRHLLDDQALSQVNPNFEQVGFQGPQTDSKRKVKGESAESSSAQEPALSLGDLIPRADISNLLSPALLEQLGDESSKTAWKVRMKAIDDIIDILHGAKCRIELTKPVKLATAELRKRLHDSNRNLAAKAVTAIGLMGASVGGDGVVSLAKGSASPLLSCLGDIKKPVVHATENALEQWSKHDGVVHKGAFLSIIQHCPTPLSDSKLDRKVLMQWFIKSFPFDESDRNINDVVDALHGLGEPLVVCLQSRDQNERKFAVDCIAVIVRFLGREDGESLFRNSSRDLKPAVARGIAPLLKQAYDTVDIVSTNSDARSTSDADNGDTLSDTKSQRALSVSSSTRIPSKRISTQFETKKAPSSRMSRIGTTNGTSTARSRKPTATLSRGPDAAGATIHKKAAPASPVSANASFPVESVGDEVLFKPIVPGLREKREEKGRKKRWPAMFDEKDKRRMEEYQASLKEDFDKVVSKEILSLMFTDADGGRGSRGSGLDPAFSSLIQEIPNQCAEALESFDLLLKWSTIQLMNNNSTVTFNVLQLLEVMFEMASSSEYSLSEYEASAFMPHILAKLGEKQKRFRDSIRVVLKLVCQVYPYSKYIPYLFNEIQPGQRSSFVLAECLDELARLAKVHGLSVLRVKVGVNQNLLRLVVSYVGDSRKETRNAALLFVEQIWEHSERSNENLFKTFSQHKVNATDKAVTLIENHLQTAATKAPMPMGDDSSHAGSQFSNEDERVGSAPQRTLRLNHPGQPSRRVEKSAAETSSRIPGPSSPPRESAPRTKPRVTTPLTPETKPGGVSSRLQHASTAKKSLSGVAGVDFLDLDLPTTPPSPSERKRIHDRGSLIKTPQEKENDPNTDSLSQAMYQAGLDDVPSSFQLNQSNGKAAIHSPLKFVKTIEELEQDLREYRDLVLRKPVGNASAARERGIKALALLGSRDPPPGWIESGLGQQKEWISLLGDNLPVAQVLDYILDMLTSAVVEAEQIPPLHESETYEAAHGENRLLKLFLPPTLTIVHWAELRCTLMDNHTVLMRWVTCFCDLVSRLMHQAAIDPTLEGSQDSEEKFEIRQERSHSLKTAQTILAKLCETSLWLPTMLNRMRKCNENCREFSELGQFDICQDELRLKRVLRSSMREFVALQESMVTPFEVVSMKETARALDDLLTVGIVPSDVDGKEDRACVEKIVQSILVSDGKRFTEHVPSHDGPHKPAQSLRVVIAKILEEGRKKEQASGRLSVPVPATKQARETFLSNQDEMYLAHIFSRISEAITAGNKAERDQALLELHEFDDSHPGFDAKMYLGSTSSWFQKYILDELNKRRETDSSQSRQMSVNVASIRERIGKLRSDFVRKSSSNFSTASSIDFALSPTSPARFSTEFDSQLSVSPAREGSSATSPYFPNSDSLAEDFQQLGSLPTEIKAATDKANAVVASATSSLESIRERMAARRRAANLTKP